ncbi:response regulator transcription factor [Clostridium oceanicum]|uniref:Stage 0 sporulation protein A homolog n=1 Tax=Clostridium oceanicum TaxID=1543 RepID=A0ABN1JGK5_9CLOT
MENKKNILIVDDEKKIVSIIKDYLLKNNFNVFTAFNGLEALEIFNNKKIHLVVLDLMLPKLSGEDVCKKIRSKSDIPIIMLTAKIEEDNKIEGLTIGADDYLTKPFSIRELVTRIKVLIRRSYRNNSTLAEYLTFNEGDLKVDINKMVVKKKDIEVNLTHNEFKILLSFLTNPGQVFTREQLIEKTFGIDYTGFDRSIDSHIKNLRHKIEDNPRKPQYILTVYGVGYKFGGN